jgi:hypothetical protein
MGAGDKYARFAGNYEQPKGKVQRVTGYLPGKPSIGISVYKRLSYFLPAYGKDDTGFELLWPDGKV